MGAACGDPVEQCPQPFVRQRTVRADQGLVVSRRLDQQIRPVGPRLGAVPGEPEQRGVPGTRFTQPLADAVLDRFDGRLPVEQHPRPGTGTRPASRRRTPAMSLRHPPNRVATPAG